MNITPTLPPRPANARPFLWSADDARIAARVDEARTATAAAELAAAGAVDDVLALALELALATPSDEQLAKAAR